MTLYERFFEAEKLDLEAAKSANRERSISPAISMSYFQIKKEKDS